MIELHASKLECEADLVAWNNKAKKDLQCLIQNQRIPQFFGQIPYRPDIEYRFPAAQWDLDAIKTAGLFTGAFLSPQDAAKEPCSNWTELIGLIGNCVAAARAVVRSRI